jgi:hypothetical protein
MDIGVPLRDLGRVEVGALLERIKTLTEADWTANTFRQDALAASAHSVTDNILFKHEWHHSASSTGIRHFEDLVWVWAKERNLDPYQYLPVEREETDVWPVFTLPDYRAWEPILGPIVEQAIAKLKTPHGVITRLALVRLKAGADIDPHIDGHAMAVHAHRVHISLSSSPSVEYKIGGRKFVMEAGHAYDFNNRIRHSVKNKGRRDRINLFVDYYADPGIVVQNPLELQAPLQAPPTPRRERAH